MPINIAENGTSEYVIAVSMDRIASEVTAANELQNYLYKSTGVRLPIVDHDKLTESAPAIMVGKSDYSESAGSEQWIIKTVGNRLFLTGGRPRGTLYAVYHYLEDYLGIHWWTIWDETVPEHKVLPLDQIDTSGEPGFGYRDIYDAELPWPKEFYVRNRVNGHFSLIPTEFGGTIQYGPPHHVHTFDHYFPPKVYFDSHPEYFSLSDGKRQPTGQLCLTNKDVFNIWIEKLKGYIKESYAEADKTGADRPVFFSISQNDWVGSCECDSCKAIYEKENHSGLSLMFVNAVAEEIEKEYPEILIDTLAYWFYEEPPKTVRPRKNVRVRVCDMGEDVMHSIAHENNKEGLRRLREWSQITDHLNVWKYAVIYSPNLPTPSQLDYADDVRAYKECGVEGIFVELENAMTTDMWEMKAWMLSKLYEDPYANIDTLVDTFTDGYYGPAGVYIREYLDLIHEALEKKPSYINFGGSPLKYTYLDLDLVLKCDAVFEKAEKSVIDDEDFLDRVRLARTSLDRTVCYRGEEFIKEHRLRGKSEDIGISVETSSKRASEILYKMADKRFASNPKHAKDAYDQATTLEFFNDMSKALPLPEQFKSVPENKVFDFSPKSFRLVGPVMVKDTSAAYGAAAKLDYAASGSEASKFIVNKTEGMPIGSYNVGNQIFGQSINITLDDIKPGYSFYKLGPAKFGPTEYLNMFWDWTLQMDLTPVITDNPDQEYEVYASVRFEGPSFGCGDSAQTNAIYVDRVIVVQI